MKINFSNFILMATLTSSLFLSTTLKASDFPIENIPEASKLLLYKKEKDAITFLLDNKNTFETFPYGESEQSDMVIAIEYGYVNYLKNAIPYIKDINKRYKYNGEDNFTLLMHSAATKNDNTYEIAYILLNNGANDNLKSFNNATAISIAEDVNNNEFLRAYSDFLNNINLNKKILTKNTSLSKKDIEHQKFLIDKLTTEKINDLRNNYKSLFAVWIRFIMMGYNEGAEIVYNELLNFKEFSLDDYNNKGVSPLIACSLSSLAGGNVEYAYLLKSRGADLTTTPKGITIAQAALIRDNYKIVHFSLSNGYNPLIKDDTGFDLFDAAIDKPIAFKSAYVIKNFLNK